MNRHTDVFILTVSQSTVINRLKSDHKNYWLFYDDLNLGLGTHQNQIIWVNRTLTFLVSNASPPYVAPNISFFITACKSENITIISKNSWKNDLIFNLVNQAIDSAPPIGGGIPPAKPASINPVPALVDPPKPIVPAAEIQPPVEPPAAQPQPVVPVAAEVPAPLPVDDGPPLVQPNALPPIPAAAPAGAPAGEAVSYSFLGYFWFMINKKLKKITG